LNDFKDKSVEREENFKLGLRTSCPEGTVPIRRTSKKDLLRAKRYANIQKKTNLHPTGGDTFGDGNSVSSYILQRYFNFFLKE
jgi:Neprosin activation peptide